MKGLTEQQVRLIVEEIVRSLDDKVQDLARLDKVRRDSLDELTKRVEGLEERVDAFREWAEGLQRRHAAMGTKLADIDTNFSALRRDVDALEADLQDLRKESAPQSDQGDVATLAIRLLAAERGLAG